MKAIKLLSLSSKGTVFFEDSGSIRQSNFQSFTINTSPLSRYLFSKVFSEQISCTFSKTGKIRYSNQAVIEGLLRDGVFKINQEEIKDSKVFGEDERNVLRGVAGEFCQEKVQEREGRNIIDCLGDRTLLMKIYSQYKQIVGDIECVDEQLLIKTTTNNIPTYLPLKLQNINHYFQLLQPKTTSKFLLSNKSLKITLKHPYMNLTKKRYECLAIFPLNVQQIILENGWGTLNYKNMNRMNAKNMFILRECQKRARAGHLGIFKKPFQILNFVFTKNSVVGVVEEILEGYCFKVRNKKQEQIKVQLANVYCPIQNQVGAFQCREFARKNLLGKEINIFTKKDHEFNLEATVVRVSDNKDIQILMIQNGYGFVKEELKGTMMVNKLQALEKRTKEKKKGLHDPQNIGVQHYQDFTLPYNKKDKLQKKAAIQKKIKYLQQTQQQTQGVIQKVLNLTTFIVRIPSAKKILKIKIDGVKSSSGNPLLPQIKQINEISNIFTYRNFFQRTVYLNINDFDEMENNFIGEIYINNRGGKKSFQEILLAEGLVYTEGFYSEKWNLIEQEAKKNGKNIWNSKMKALVKNTLFEDQPEQFLGKLSWVDNGERAYVQPEVVNSKLDEVYEALNKQPLPKISEQCLVVGYICGAQFQEEICRAKIISINNTQITVFFIDWGNKEQTILANLYQIPNQLQYIAPLCCQIKLDLVAPLKLLRLDKQFVERVREIMMEDDVRIQKIYGNLVNVYTKGSQHLNTSLIEQGYMKADLNKISDENVMESFKEIMENLRKNLIGIWENDDYSDEELETQYIY